MNKYACPLCIDNGVHKRLYVLLILHGTCAILPTEGLLSLYTELQGHSIYKKKKKKHAHTTFPITFKTTNKIIYAHR